MPNKIGKSSILVQKNAKIKYKKHSILNQTYNNQILLGLVEKESLNIEKSK